MALAARNNINITIDKEYLKFAQININVAYNVSQKIMKYKKF
jgi:hypothetical protein